MGGEGKKGRQGVLRLVAVTPRETTHASIQAPDKVKTKKCLDKETAREEGSGVTEEPTHHIGQQGRPGAVPGGRNLSNSSHSLSPLSLHQSQATPIPT